LLAAIVARSHVWLYVQALLRGVNSSLGPLFMLWIARNTRGTIAQGRRLTIQHTTQFAAVMLSGPLVAGLSRRQPIGKLLGIICAAAVLACCCVASVAAGQLHRPGSHDSSSTPVCSCKARSSQTGSSVHKDIPNIAMAEIQFLRLQFCASLIRGLALGWMRDLNSIVLHRVYHVELGVFSSYQTVVNVVSLIAPLVLVAMVESSSLHRVVLSLGSTHLTHLIMFDFPNIINVPSLWRCLLGQLMVVPLNNTHGTLMNLLMFSNVSPHWVAACSTVDFMAYFLGQMMGGLISAQICVRFAFSVHHQYLLVFGGATLLSFCSPLLMAAHTPVLFDYRN